MISQQTNYSPKYWAPSIFISSLYCVKTTIGMVYALKENDDAYYLQGVRLWWTEKATQDRKTPCQLLSLDAMLQQNNMCDGTEVLADEFIHLCSLNSHFKHQIQPYLPQFIVKRMLHFEQLTQQKMKTLALCAARSEQPLVFELAQIIYTYQPWGDYE